MNSRANDRLNDYNTYWVPSCYIDGGKNYISGTNQGTLASNIQASGVSTVNDIDLSITTTWLGDAQIEITVHIDNHQFFNSSPEIPSVPVGPDVAMTTYDTEISTSATDGDGHDLWYQFNWGDGETSDWIGPYPSGDQVTAMHKCKIPGSYSIRANVKDEYDAEPEYWSPVKTVEVVRIGDANDDGTSNVGDAVFLINFVFKGGPAPEPNLRGDANCDHGTNVGDAVYVINYVFKGGPAPGCQ